MPSITHALFSMPVAAVLFLGVGVCLYLFLLRGARLQPEPWYVGEACMGGFLVPLIVICLAGGAGTILSLVMGLHGERAEPASVTAALGLAAVFAAVCYFQVRAVPGTPETPSVHPFPTGTGTPTAASVPPGRRAA